MAVWGCAVCRTCYRVRLFRCPRCHGTAFEEESMPKISRASGASHAAAVRVQKVSGQQPASESPRPVESVAAGGVVEDGPAPAVLPEREHPGTGVPMEGVEAPADGTWSPEIVGDGSGEALPLAGGGEEESSPGSSSETLPVKPPSLPVTSETVPQKRARTTGSRSKRGRTGSSTARSTASSTEADEAS